MTQEFAKFLYCKYSLQSSFYTPEIFLTATTPAQNRVTKQYNTCDFIDITFYLCKNYNTNTINFNNVVKKRSKLIPIRYPTIWVIIFILIKYFNDWAHMPLSNC